MSMTDLSAEPFATRHLTDAQKEHLSMLLERYMSGLENGLPPTVDELTSDSPELRQPLRYCVAGLQNLHRMAAGLDPASCASSFEQSTASLAPSSYASRSVSAMKTAIDTRNREGQPSPHGRRLGDFYLHEQIGRGGMGVVYRATQRSLKRTVAIKLLPLPSILDSRQITRFQHEAEAAGGLQHPHIVPVYAVGCERGVHYYAMQFIDGMSVDEIILKRSLEFQSVDQGDTPSQSVTDDWRTTVGQAIQAAEGLHAAHEFGVVHRDVKPSNLLIDQNGKLWVTDFGLARVQSDVSLTQSGDIVGTMKYMSPEQARGESAIVDGRTDVYSLGVTLYEMLTLRPAHEGDDAPAILRTIENDAIVPLRKRCPHLPRDLATVVAKAMAKNRDGRYETAKAFADDLRRVLAGEPTIARPPTLMDRIGRLANKHRRSVAVSMIVCMFAMVGFAIFTVMLAAEKQVSDANESIALAHQMRAIRNEQIAREWIDRIGSQMAELLDDIPAAAPVRRRLLGETLDYYKRFVSEASDDPTLRKELAVTYGKIGAFQSELGASEEAIAALERSEQLYHELARQSPGDAALSLQWSISQNNLAEKFSQIGRIEQAAHWFGNAIVIQQRLLNPHLDSKDSSMPENIDAIVVTRELATTLNNLGLLLEEAEKTQEANTVYRRAIKLLETSANEAGLLASIQSNLAGLLSKRSPEQAIQFAQKALAQQTKSLAQNQGDAKLATQVVLTLNSLGTSHAQRSQHAEAIQSFEEAIEIAQQLQTRWPDSPAYSRDLVISLNHLGLSLAALGKRHEAKNAFEKALPHQRSLAALYPDDAEVQSMLGGVLNNLGFLQQQLGNGRVARQYFIEAAEHQSRAVQLAPEVPRYQAYLAKHQHNSLTLGNARRSYDD
ncbi:protein kinase [Novipirellula sp.]|uniref:protein kinase domain-containing protein n=1 Tax=Novipirellula sp. TaxID=2795430 RepID=UPI00356A90CD